jgi:GNAT superfamily N-acetyltransferase
LNRTLKIRRYHSDDKSSVLKTFKAAFNKNYPPALWKWKFENNPFQPIDHPMIYVATSHGQIAGSAGLLPVPFQIEGHPVSFCWGTDLMVHPDFQGRGIARQIYQFLTQQHVIIMSIGATAGAAYLLENKTNWFKMEGAKKRTRYLDLQPYFQKMIPRISHPLGQFSRWVLKDLCSWKHYDRRNHQIKDILEIGPEFDKLWKALEPCFPISVTRTRQYLKWRYRGNPHHSHRIYGIYQAELLSAFMVMAFNKKRTESGFKEAIIMELVADPRDSECIKTLIDSAVYLAIERGCHVVRCFSSPILENYFRGKGFYHLPKQDSYFFGTLIPGSIPARKIQNTSWWMLSCGDMW